MRLVTFSREMSPYGIGDTRLVPDDVAIALEKDEAISSNEPWPAQAPQEPKKPVRPILKPTRPAQGPDRRATR